jgi:peptidoglycan/LPS O-acetylase OafA/YrhL
MAQTRLAVLDGLRGIAVLLVLWYHVWEISWLPAPLASLQFIPETGFIGVDLFFYISGFVIVYPFVKALVHAEASPTWGHFAYRRAIKIVPSYVLCIFVLIAIGYAHFTSAGDAARDIITHLLFIHTWWSDTAGTINGVLWTLAVEVQFYALFPLIWRFFSRSPWVTAAVMIAAALAFRSYGQACCLHTTAGLMLENLPSYLDTFAFGMLSAYLYVTWRERIHLGAQRIGATAAAIAGFVMLALLLQNLWATRLTSDWSTAWQIHNRTLVGASFVLIGLGSLLSVRLWQRVVANPILLFMGVISYNLYLYHQAFARELLAWRIPPYHGADQHADPHWELTYTFVAFALTIAQAALVTYAFERPLLRIPMQRWQQWVSRVRRAGALSGM